MYAINYNNTILLQITFPLFFTELINGKLCILMSKLGSKDDSDYWLFQLYKKSTLIFQGSLEQAPSTVHSSVDLIRF
jgi:hypothetical protein